MLELAGADPSAPASAFQDCLPTSSTDQRHVVGRMNDEQKRSVSLALLASTAGSMDAIAFLTLGNVFTSAMSGNTVLLGLSLGQGRLSAASYAFVAFIGYVVGAASGALPLRAPARSIEWTLTAEILFLAAFALLWIVRGGATTPIEIYVLIILSAVAMGLQGAVGRAIGIPGVPTIVITSTLTAIIGTIAEQAMSHDRPALSQSTRHQITTFASYLLSAIVAGFAVAHSPGFVPLIPLAMAVTLTTGLALRRLQL
jgi:uncharacterized membrane protein YoaK (UPF0700 family)